MVVLEMLRVFRFVLGYSSLFYVTASLWAWEAVAKSHLSVETQLSLYAGAFLVISYCNWREADKKAEDAAYVAAALPPAEERKFAADAADLLERYEQLPTSRRLAYLDQWIPVAGTFEGATKSLIDDAMHVSVLLESGRRIALRFPAKSRDCLARLKEGQWLRAVCQVRPGSQGFALENAELV